MSIASSSTFVLCCRRWQRLEFMKDFQKTMRDSMTQWWKQEPCSALNGQLSLQRTCRARAAAAAAAPESDILASVQEAKGATKFDVATAIALAGCAFESYNEPKRVSSKFQEKSRNGTITTYIDRRAMYHHTSQKNFCHHLLYSNCSWKGNKT